MSAKKDERFKKDLLISVLGHLALVSLIIIVNPSAGMFHGTPEHLAITNIDLGGGEDGGGAPPAPVEEVKEEEAKSLVPPPMNEEAIDDAVVEERMEPEMAEDLADIIPEEPKEKPKEEKKPEKKKEEPKPEPKKQQPTAQSKQTSDEPKETAPKTVQKDGKTGVDVDASVAAGEGTGSGGTYNLPYNIGLLTRRIERAWRNPVTSAEKISCTIYFQVDSNGQLIGEPIIERSSGISVFDRAALMAVRRAGTFPAFPSGFEYEFIGLHLDFEYVP